MTSDPLERGLSVRSFLFDRADGGGGTPGLGDAVSGRQVARSALHAFRHLSTAVLGAVDREVGDVAEGMLDIELGEALVHGWAKHAKLMGAARRTLTTPGGEVVPLAAHRVTSTYRPNVDLVVDSGVVGSVEFEVQLVFDINALAAVVRAGSLVAVRGGDMLLTATVQLYGDTIARRQHRLDPELVVRLDPPVPLATPPPGG